MFVFSFGVLSATRREHGHLVQDSRIQCSIGLLDLGLTTRTACVIPASRRLLTRPGPLERGHAPDYSEHIAIKADGIARNQFRSAQRCGERRDERRHEGSLSYFNADTD